MSKFAKLFEHENGEQLLVTIQQNEEKEDQADLCLQFEFDGAVAKITISGGTWESIERALLEYKESNAMKILDDPEAFIFDLMN